MFDEPLSWQMGAGMAISAIGIWLVMRAEARLTPSAVHAVTGLHNECRLPCPRHKSV
jgi:hypothetical protein